MNSKIDRLLIMFLGIVVPSMVISQEVDHKPKSNINLVVGNSYIYLKHINSSNNSRSFKSHRDNDFLALSIGYPLRLNHRLITEFAYSEVKIESFLENLELNWFMRYFGMAVGYSVPIIKRNSFLLESGGLVGGDFLISAEQNIGNKIYFSQNNSFFSISNFKASLKTDFCFELSRNINFNTHFRYSIGVSQIENNDTNPNQKSFLRSFTTGLGITYFL